MTSELILEWDGRPDAEARLTPEIYAGFGTSAPAETDYDDTAFETDRPDTLGVVTARRDGRLLGWSWVYRDPDDAATARAQAAYLPREAARFHGEADPQPTPDEFDVITRLYLRSADAARAIGLRALRFSGGDTQPEGQAAARLHARAEPGDSRIWFARPASWQPPADLPAPAELITSATETPPHTTFSVSTPRASITALAVDDQAYINVGEDIDHDDAEPEELAALFAALLTQLREARPEVTELGVFEFSDEAVRRALPMAGLHLRAQHTHYEVPLIPG
ncbi:hypothetical protein [Nocardia sp. NPDC127526]|uniref:hypothetical protein n=1 Tax=Nocardia sp. NPDC127526 TaxID=3345393 RepID=UPI0036276BE6